MIARSAFARRERDARRPRGARALGPPVARGVQGVAVTAIALFLVAPLVAVVYVSFSPVAFFQFPPEGASLRWFQKLWQTPELIHALERSLVIAVVVVAITGILAVMAALGLDRARFRGRGLLDTFFQSPLIVPELIFGIALLQIYAPLDLNATYLGIVLAHVAVAFPYSLRSIYVGLEARDRTTEEAAAVLGASPLRIFTSVTLPTIKGAVASGAIFSFIASFDQFSVSLFIVGNSTQTLPVTIYNRLFANSDPTVAAISTVVIAIGLAAALLANGTVGLDRLLVSGEGGARRSG